MVSHAHPACDAGGEGGGLATAVEPLQSLAAEHSFPEQQ